MAVGAIPVRIGDVEVLVETVTVAGSEPTSRLSDAAEAATDVLSRMQKTILGMATTAAETITEAGHRGARPDHLEVEFTLNVSAKGNVIVAGASGDAGLRVMLSYDARSE